MKILSLDELAIELKKYVNTGIESQKLKDYNAALLLQENENIKKKNYFKEYSSLYEKALILEKTDVHGALDVYFDILNKYIPEGSSYYERPCIILEKLKRYDEAIEICNLAITRVEKNNFHFSADDFKKRLNRLIKKNQQ